MRVLGRMLSVMMLMVTAFGCGGKTEVVDMGEPQTEQNQERINQMMQGDQQMRDALKQRMIENDPGLNQGTEEEPSEDAPAEETQ